MNDPADTSQPNVILVLVDDMGFSDIGIMGSEIATPNIDALATNGLLFTSMYNGARCCPTRAALLTGLYSHNAGIGHMGTNLGTPAYQGFLRDDALTVAEVLQASGYRTLMSGKWHVGGDLHANQSAFWDLDSPEHPTPRQRGFDHFYGTLDGATSFFDPHYVMRNDKKIDIDPTGYYFTDAITDEAIDMVDSARAASQPFFLYLAHTAPHWPLHAYEEDLAKYESTYRVGWDTIRTARHEEMQSRNLLETRWGLSARDSNAPPWESMQHPEWEASKMTAYAAMVDRLDQSMGRLIAHLKSIDAFDDTLILFLSDNGGCAEFMAEDGWAISMPDYTLDGQKMTMGNITNLRPGDRLTYQSYDLPWANVSNAPFRLFKHWVHEGGISTPLIAHWPKGIERRGVVHDPCHVIDLLPTILDATGTAMLTERGDMAAQTLDGESFADAFLNPAWERDAPLFWEHEGNAAVRVGDVKLVREHGQPWELYDMHEDRTELHNLAGSDKPKVAELSSHYDGWAASVGVREWDELAPLVQAAWGMDDLHG